LKKIGILKATSDELSAMIGGSDPNALKKLRRMGPPICIHTMGSEGLDLLIPSGFFHTSVKVVSFTYLWRHPCHNGNNIAYPEYSYADA
jgi:sugar/nucleoside kinase (ribokinase family)